MTGKRFETDDIHYNTVQKFPRGIWSDNIYFPDSIKKVIIFELAQAAGAFDF